ncbi:IMP dehydrogenase [Hyperthermus butylicus]|uniref:IMP dehydrogenase n=1 Tax=Hyperthermus butylicus TaxID=54248 RepID=UPI001E319D69|nr:IMP dehydrogenase [Hyperthermus butylicus]
MLYLEPGRAEVEPHQVKTDTRFSRNVRLKIPLASSPMDIVTEREMAIDMALHGGIGVVHRNLPIARQVEDVRAVKEYPAALPLRPLYASQGEPCTRILEVMRKEGVRQLPIIDAAGKASWLRLLSHCL